MASSGSVSVTCPSCGKPIAIPITLTLQSRTTGSSRVAVTVKAKPVRHTC